VLLAIFARDLDQADGLEMRSISVRTRDNKEVWRVSNDFGKGGKSINDLRTTAGVCEIRPMDTLDRSLCQFETPPFGKFEDFLRRAVRYLEKEGFGALPR
jgi:hypothetical protein